MGDYGTRIKKHRDQRGFSQEYMAERLGMSQNSFHKIETGQTKLKASTMQQIADILEVNVLDLLNDDMRKFKIRQTSHDSSTGVAIYNQNIEEERTAWKIVEASLREVIEAQKGVIDSLRETINLQTEMLRGFQK